MNNIGTFEQGTNIILSHSKNQYFSRLPNPRVFSKKKRNQSLPLFGVVFKLSQVPSVGKEEKEKERVSVHFLLLLQSKLAACADILTCGGPQLCWRGPLRWRRRRLRCEPSVRPERSRPTLLSLQGSLLLTHIQTFHLLVELRQVCSSRLTSNRALRPKSFALSTQHPAGWILSVPLLMISSAFFLYNLSWQHHTSREKPTVDRTVDCNKITTLWENNNLCWGDSTFPWMFVWSLQLPLSLSLPFYYPWGSWTDSTDLVQVLTPGVANVFWVVCKCISTVPDLLI